VAIFHFLLYFVIFSFTVRIIVVFWFYYSSLMVWAKFCLTISIHPLSLVVFKILEFSFIMIRGSIVFNIVV